MKQKILAFITAAMCFAGAVPVNAAAENSDKGVVGLQEEGGSKLDGLTISKGTKQLTLSEVISLAKKGNALDWADFQIYSGQESGHGYTDWVFELEDGYTLRVRGESKDKAPETITLYRNDQIKGCEEIDIRTDDVEAFLESKQYYFNEIGSMTKSELKALFDKKGLTEDKGYGVWTKEEVAAVLKDHTITLSLKPDARFITKDGTEVLNETSSVEEFLKYDEYNITQANYLDFATELPRDEIFLLFINTELRTEVNEKGEYIYRRYFKYRFGSMFNDEATQIKKITTALNYLQLNPYFDGFELNTDAAYGGTEASTVKARVLDINEKSLLLQSVSNCDDRYLLFNEQINSDITPTAGMELDITYDGGMFKLDSVLTIGDVKKVSVVSEKTESLKGDTNCDGQVDMADAVLIMQALANPNKYGEYSTKFNYLTALGRLNGDMNGDGITVGDAQAIQRKLLGLDEKSADLEALRKQLSDFFNEKKIDYTVIPKDKMPEQFADKYVFIRVNTSDTSYAVRYGAFLTANGIDRSLIKSIPYKTDSDTELNKIRELLYCYILENNINASVDPTNEEEDLKNKMVFVKYADSSGTRSQLENFLKEKNIDLDLVEFWSVE